MWAQRLIHYIHYNPVHAGCMISHGTGCINPFALGYIYNTTIDNYALDHQCNCIVYVAKMTKCCSFV